MKLEVGDEVDQYHIIRELGQGGIGAVYEVEHAKFDNLPKNKLLEFRQVVVAGKRRIVYNIAN